MNKINFALVVFIGNYRIDKENTHVEQRGKHKYLQVCSHKRFATCVVKVALHEEVEKMGRVTTDGAQLGVTALEDFIAERGTHVGPSIKEGTRELEDMEKKLYDHFKKLV